jgi:hypothetical protein
MVLIPAAHATILEDTWEVSGLAGTGSHDFTVEQVFVPDAYTWRALQRALRDVHAVTQHIGAAPQQYEEAGRMVLGLDPLQPIVLW